MIITVPTSYKSSKGGSWIDGYAKLIRTGNGTTANWILSDARHKALKKLEVNQHITVGTVVNGNYAYVAKETKFFWL